MSGSSSVSFRERLASLASEYEVLEARCSALAVENEELKDQFEALAEGTPGRQGREESDGHAEHHEGGRGTADAEESGSDAAEAELSEPEPVVEAPVAVPSIATSRKLPLPRRVTRPRGAVAWAAADASADHPTEVFPGPTAAVSKARPPPPPLRTAVAQPKADAAAAKKKPPLARRRGAPPPPARVPPHSPPRLRDGREQHRGAVSRSRSRRGDDEAKSREDEAVLGKAEVVEGLLTHDKQPSWRAEIICSQLGATNHSARAIPIRGPSRPTQEQAERDAEELDEVAKQGLKAVRSSANKMHRL